MDDHDGVRVLGDAALDRAGYHVLTAGSGEEAFRVVREQGDDVYMVVLEVGMPGMGGHACFTGLRQMDPAVVVKVPQASGRAGFTE